MLLFGFDNISPCQELPRFPVTPPFHLLSHTLTVPTRSSDVISKSNTQEVPLPNFLTQATLFPEPLLAMCPSCLHQKRHHPVSGCHHPSDRVPDHKITCSCPSSCFRLGTQPTAVVLQSRSHGPSETDPSGGLFSSHQLSASSWQLSPRRWHGDGAALWYPGDPRCLMLSASLPSSEGKG